MESASSENIPTDIAAWHGTEYHGAHGHGVHKRSTLPIQSTAGQRPIRGHSDKAICLFTYFIVHLCKDKTSTECFPRASSIDVAFIHWFGVRNGISVIQNLTISI